MMLIATSTGRGLQKTIKEKLVAFNGNIQLFHYEGNKTEVEINPIALPESFLNEIKSMPGVKRFYNTATKGGIIRTRTAFEGILAKGIEGDYVNANLKPYITAGSAPDFSSGISNECLVSEFLANRLELKPGDPFQILFFTKDSDIPSQRYLKVKGIYKSSFEEFDSNYIFIDIRHVKHVNHWSSEKIGMLEVFTENMEVMPLINQKLYEDSPSDITTRTITAKYPMIIDWLKLMDYNIFIIIAIMIVVGGVNMITTMLVTVIDRIQMIGSLKALGMKNGSVRKIFIYQAIYQIGYGLLFGNIIGLGLLFLQTRFGIIHLNPNIYYVSQAPVFITPTEVLGLNLGILVACTLMLIIPSYVVAKISPVRAMKAA